MTYSKARYAFGFCDRTGFRYPLKDLVPEYNNGVKTGFLVGRDVADPDQPQNFLGRIKVNDPQSLRNPRPDTSLLQSRELFGFNPVWNPAQYMVASVGRVTVSVSDTGNEIVNVTGSTASLSVGSVSVNIPQSDATANLTGISSTSSVGSASAFGIRATYAITVVNPGSGNVYYQNGSQPGGAGVHIVTISQATLTQGIHCAFRQPLMAHMVADQSTQQVSHMRVLPVVLEPTHK